MTHDSHADQASSLRGRSGATAPETPPSPFWRSRGALVAIGFLLAAAFLLFSEHRVHALGYLPYLLLLACPLMHLFMHHGHGHHEGHARPGNNKGPSPIPEDKRDD